MSEKIEVGDLVMVVHQPCCGNAYGATGNVVSLRVPNYGGNLVCCGCGIDIAKGGEVVAETDIPSGRPKTFPLHWLKRINPPALPASTATSKELAI